MYNKWNDVKGKIDSQSPLIHCITSPIAINDCANAVLALGAKPIMAEHPLEVENITLMSKSLAVSLANITDARAESIMISGKAACKAGISSVIDLVGVTCSKMRADLHQEADNQSPRRCYPSCPPDGQSEGLSAGLWTGRSGRRSSGYLHGLEQMVRPLRPAPL